MSWDKTAMPPPRAASIPSLGNGKSIVDDGGFAMPLPPPPSKLEIGHKPAEPARKRKSRFSDAPPSSAAPPPKVLQTLSSLEHRTAETSDANDNKAALVSAAAAAAARINASLLAQGKLKTSQQSQLTSQSTASTPAEPPNPVLSAEIKTVDDMYVAEVEINDVPVGCRNYLTRLSTQESINKSYMAFVSTRGKYMTTEEKKQHPLLLGGEKPLYLFVQSQSEAGLKKALDRIKQIINNHYEKKSRYQSEALAQIASLSQKAASGGALNAAPNSTLQAFTPGYPLIPTTTTAELPHFQPALPSGNFVQEKVFIGMDGVPDHLDLKSKLLGQSYRNFNFIANQTGAKVILRGKGSGFIEPTSGREAFESMYAFISHPNQAGVDAAKKLVLNLIETVKTQLAPLAKTTQTSNPAGFSSSQGSVSYNAVPPPAPVPPPLTQTAGSITAYPFQQTKVQSVPLSGSADARSDDNSHAPGYQHNFAGSDYSSRFETPTKSVSKDKPRKRFTEEPVMTPSYRRPEINDHKSADEDTANPGRKTASLPFWMTN